MRHHFMAWGLAALLAFAVSPVRADGVENMTRLLKAGDSAGTHSKTSAAQTQVSGDPRAIRLTPDRTRILRLRESAASVIVTNPVHATVTLDSPRLLILMPREPGTTSFTVLDAAGKVLLERNIIVGTVRPQYVRVRRVCGSTRDCEPSNYYYCPDGCFEVTPVVHENTGSIPEIQGGGAPMAPFIAADDDTEDSMIIEEMEGPMIIEDDGAPDDGDFGDFIEGETE